MSTKLKTIPLPAGLAPLPKGSVYLGEIDEQKDPFEGWNAHPSEVNGKWEWYDSYIGGGGHYAAPRNSAIAREILGVPPTKKAHGEAVMEVQKIFRDAKKAAKKAPALRKLPKNVKPGTKVVLHNAEGCIGVKKGATETLKWRHLADKPASLKTVLLSFADGVVDSGEWDAEEKCWQWGVDEFKAAEDGGGEILAWAEMPKGVAKQNAPRDAEDLRHY